MSDVVTALSFLSTSPPENNVVHAPEIPVNSKNESDEEEEEESVKSNSDSSDEEDGSYHNKDKSSDDETAKEKVSASAKYQESDVSDDYYENEEQREYSPQDTKDEYYSKPSRKSSTRSKNANNSCDSEDGISKAPSHKSSIKSSHGVGNGNISKKSSTKSCLSQKKSKKCVRVLSQKRSSGNDSMSSEESHDEGDAVFDRSESRPSQGNMSSGLFSIDQSVHSDYHYSMDRRSEEGSNRMHILDHTSSSGSDEENLHPPYILSRLKNFAYKLMYFKDT
ncbi:unnamed protein product [Lupinus luteus]|uniref:Uncharacterized protein n=1 Tax=Lupinus luteus TaxID=3873 RepID=A0AAV1WPH1_LUPLU